jgi:hypothetical protein
MPRNETPANCSSEQTARLDHANHDVRMFIGREMQGQRREPLSNGEIIQVTYDDGSTEQWVATGLSGTYLIGDSPVPGTLEYK